MRLHDSKGPTVLGLLFWFLVISLFGIFLISNAQSRERLNLSFSVEVQYRLSEVGNWERLEEKSFDGVGAYQFHLDSNRAYRLVMRVRKPNDLSGAFRVRMVTRTDGVSVPKGTEEGTIIFGPQENCSGNRCNPLSLEDVGLVELRLDLEKAEETAIGAFTLRPYDSPPPIAIRTTYFHGDREIPCGSTVSKGWWIFAKKLTADGSKVDTISACVKKPSAKTICSDDREEQVKVRANEKGTFKFSLWNTKAIEDRCEFTVK